MLALAKLELSVQSFAMPKKSPPNPAGRKGRPISLAPLTPEQALSAALRVKLSDVKKLEAAETKGKKRRKG